MLFQKTLDNHSLKHSKTHWIIKNFKTMDLKYSLVKDIPPKKSVIYLIRKDNNLGRFAFNEAERKYITEQVKDGEKQVSVNSYNRWSYIQVIDKETDPDKQREKCRRAGSEHSVLLKKHKHSEIVLADAVEEPELILAFAEGLVLANYGFLRYFGDKAEKKHPLKNILIVSDRMDKQEITILKNLIEAVYFVRDMVNEPLSFMNAVQFSETVKQLGISSGFSVEVFNKKKIESLKMGGLLAVNRGSIDPPTFTVLEWMPDNAVNKKPLVLVGKGVVFDTGGLSLKPTLNSMDYMKCDMGGAAAVAGVLYAVAKSKIPVKVIGLLPATDNRPDGNAVAPGDVITMHNGKTVEVLNTDAEGRLILADAISYAGKYKPELIIDIATLTGSAALAIGRFGIVGMGNAKSRYMKSLIHSGDHVHERIVEFPFWEEFDKLLESNIADLKNIAERDAGAITAGKFLEQFTGYPLIHLDIAGPAFLKKANSYQGKGATAIGVRLLFDFICNFPNLFEKDR